MQKPENGKRDHRYNGDPVKSGEDPQDPHKRPAESFLSFFLLPVRFGTAEPSFIFHMITRAASETSHPVC